MTNEDKIDIQIALETATDATFKTGNPVFLSLPSVRKAKRDLLEILRAEKQGHSHTNGDYGGGGVTE